MPKPPEIKKRARRLAQDGKIVDAIRVLEDLVAGEHVDPYDLVTLGDLCVRGGRAADAVEYYARAVQAYKDASLLRNGIALCRKVVRTQAISDKRFLLLLGELCEREGLVVDAVMSYIEYAETLTPGERLENARWLDSLSRLSPKSVELLTRQADVLSRWRRTSQAVALLRLAADSTGITSDRDTLFQAADQLAARGVDADEEEPEGTDARAAFPRESHRDMGEGRDELTDWMGPSPPTGERPPFDTGPLNDLDLGIDITEMSGPGPEPAATELASSAPDDDVLDVPDLETAAGAAGITGTRPAPAPRKARGARRPAADHGIDAAEIEALQTRLRADPFNIALLTKLLEVYEAEEDILSALDLRERLAQALEQKGDPEGALRHYQAILRVEPRHRTVRERARRLAQDLGQSIEESADPTVREPGALDLNGITRVEVRDDASKAGEEDMVDLGSLLDEFREGLKGGMAEASAKAHYDMGLSHMEMELYAEAAEAFEAASADPDLEPEARELWGRCLREAGKTTESVRVLRAALALRPESLGVRYQLALALEADGDPGEALRLHQSILREDPDFEDSRERSHALGGSDCPTPPPS